MRVIASSCLLLIVLAACSPSDDANNSNVVEKPDTGITVKAESKTAKTSSDTASQSSQLEDSATKVKKKLDLSIPSTIPDTATGSVEASKDKPLLPDMFAKEESTTTIGGGLIRDAENEDYIDSIEGATIDIKVKTD